ncbi:hypothetical protein FRB90_012844 [Tulasnella sp. 427]|nr:hypothetical protein FRB90_012844 [Tulasnella sp. 427]
MSRCFLSLPILVGQALAAAVLTAPAPGAVFYEGSPCSLQWNVDTVGAWKNMTIDLMSGPNLAMTKVTTVATNLDGSDPTLTPFNWTCPSVTPCSAIYFYQIYDSSTEDSPSWTGRFTIASPHGASITPPNTTQPDGEAIPWGFGALASDRSSIPLPSLAAAQNASNLTGTTATASVPTGKSYKSAQTVTAPNEEQSRNAKSRDHDQKKDADTEEGSDSHEQDDDNGADDDDDKYHDNDQNHRHRKHDNAHNPDEDPETPIWLIATSAVQTKFHFLTQDHLQPTIQAALAEAWFGA